MQRRTAQQQTRMTMNKCELCSVENDQPDESPFCSDCQENSILELEGYAADNYYTEDDIPY